MSATHSTNLQALQPLSHHRHHAVVSQIGPDPSDHHRSEAPDAVLARLLALHRVERGLVVAQILGVLAHAVELADELALPVVVDLGDELAVGVEVFSLQSWNWQFGDDHLTSAPRLARVVGQWARERKRPSCDGDTTTSPIEERRHPLAIGTESQRGVDDGECLEKVAAARDVDGGDLQRRHRDAVDHRDVVGPQTTGVQMSLGFDAPAGLVPCRQVDPRKVGEQQRHPVEHSRRLMAQRHVGFGQQRGRDRLQPMLDLRRAALVGQHVGAGPHAYKSARVDRARELPIGGARVERRASQYQSVFVDRESVHVHPTSRTSIWIHPIPGLCTTDSRAERNTQPLLSAPARRRFAARSGRRRRPGRR